MAVFAAESTGPDEAMLDNQVLVGLFLGSGSESVNPKTASCQQTNPDLLVFGGLVLGEPTRPIQ
jgi:hypothetical protein